MSRLPLRRLLMAAACLAAMLLSACGGGGGGGSPSTGGGGAPAATNVLAVSVEQGPPTSNVVNGLFATVTICVPGTETCQTIDHLLVDTGSNGLRVLASVLKPSIALPTENDSGQIVECTQFADGFTWGPVKLADVRIAGERAQNVPIQVIGDPQFTGLPNDCASTGTPENDVASFGANGLIGVGLFKVDCGAFCLTAGSSFYYRCPCDPTTTSSALPESLQVHNPIAMFANDNNGVIIELPAVGDGGAASLSGTLTFGIGTQSNNALGTAKVFTVNSSNGMFSTVYKGQEYQQSLLDSGSTASFFDDPSITVCSAQDSLAPGFYCPGGTLILQATMKGLNNVSATLDFLVGNAHNLFANNPGFWAFDDIAAPAVLPNSFIWGLPAFMGRKIYTVIDGQTVPGTGGNPDASAGPYFAFQSRVSGGTARTPG